MNCLYDDFLWHDAVIDEIKLDRRNAGYTDLLELIVTDIENKRWKVIFSDLYEVEMKMNFGVVGEESIYSIECLESSEHIQAIKRVWKLCTTLDKLKCYKITTNSTASILEIYALDILITQVNS
jgi:hypothetical protein